MREYTVDYINEFDLPQALRLLRDFIGSESYFGADNKYVRWQYFDSPFKTTMVDKNQYSMLVFLDEDRNILALDAFLPWKTYVDGKEAKTVWDIEWMNFSKIKGLGRELVKRLRGMTEIYCGYGVNQLSYNSYEKLGYPMINEIERKIAVMDAGKCLFLFGNDSIKGQKEFLRESAERCSRIRQDYVVIQDFSDISEDYWIDHTQRFAISSYKNLEVLKWRYLNHPYIYYNIITIDPEAKKGLSVVRLEKIKGVDGRVLRILEMLPVRGYEEDLTRAVLSFGRDHGLILADFFCVSKKYCDEVCRSPFIGLSEHREYAVPMLFQPIEVRERKSINMVLDCNGEFKRVSFEEFYATKGDSDQDQSINEDYRTVSL